MNISKWYNGYSYTETDTQVRIENKAKRLSFTLSVKSGRYLWKTLTTLKTL
jgi:hypothetical protein